MAGSIAPAFTVAFTAGEVSTGVAFTAGEGVYRGGRVTHYRRRR